jgi:hypothetical protein
MQIYFCYFPDDHDHISAAENIDAIERALVMLSTSRHHQAVEVWHGARRLFLSMFPHAGNMPTGGAGGPSRTFR